MILYRVEAERVIDGAEEWHETVLFADREEAKAHFDLIVSSYSAFYSGDVIERSESRDREEVDIFPDGFWGQEHFSAVLTACKVCGEEPKAKNNLKKE